MAEPRSKTQTADLSVAWRDVVRFIRQLSHDLRNHLNPIELQSAYISELEREDDVKGEIKRLREMISGLTSTLQSLSKTVSEVKPSLITYRASDVAEDLRKKVARDFSSESAKITWNIHAGDAMLDVDPQLLEESLTELLANAFRYSQSGGHVVVTAKVENERLLVTIEEPKKQFELSADNFGREPLRNVSQGHYGLGLNRVRAIVEAHGGKMYAQYNPNASILTTTVVLPVSGDSAQD